MPSRREQANAQLLQRIESIHQMSDASYGVPRMVAQLAREGLIVNKKRVERHRGQARRVHVDRGLVQPAPAAQCTGLSLAQ